MHGSNCGEEGLKRVCSAPQLGDQEKASLLKRKLSVSDTEPCVVYSGSSKHKKQGRLPSIVLLSVPKVLFFLISCFCYHTNVIYKNSKHIIVVIVHKIKLNWTFNSDFLQDLCRTSCVDTH